MIRLPLVSYLPGISTSQELDRSHNFFTPHRRLPSICCLCRRSWPHYECLGSPDGWKLPPISLNNYDLLLRTYSTVIAFLKDGFISSVHDRNTAIAGDGMWGENHISMVPCPL